MRALLLATYGEAKEIGFIFTIAVFVKQVGVHLVQPYGRDPVKASQTNEELLISIQQLIHIG